MSELLLTAAQVAKRLGVSPAMVYGLIKRGRLKGVYIGRLPRITEEALAAYLGGDAPVSSDEKLRAALRDALQPLFEEVRQLRIVMTARQEPTATAPQPKLVNLKTAARELSLSSRTLSNLIERGKIQPVRLGRRVLIRRETLDQLVAGGCQI